MEVQGTLINMWVRVSGTSNPFKKLICLENSTFSITNEISKRRTNCGIKTGIADAEFTASGSAVQDPNPDSNSVSYADVKAWAKAKTKLDFNYKNDADSGNGLDVGEGIQNYGSGFFSQLDANASAEADGLLTYDWTFDGTGTLDNYDGSETS
jgi:hypothetical protein